MPLNEEQLAMVYFSELELELIGKMAKSQRDLALKEAIANLKAELMSDISGDPEIAPEIKMQIKCTEVLMTIQNDQDWADVVLFLEEMRK